MRTILSIIFFIGFSSSYAQIVVCEQTDLVLQLIEKFHHEPEAIDQGKSTFIYESVLSNLDPQGLYFTSSQIQGLESYKSSFTKINSGNVCAFSEQLASAYKVALINSRAILNNLVSAELDFNINETVEIYYKTPTFAASDAELKQRWYNWLKLQVLTRYFSSLNDDQLKDEKKLKEKFNVEKSKIITNVISREQKRIEFLFKKYPDFKELVAEQTLKAICSVFDPHSEYLSVREKNEFEEDLSSKEFSFGLAFEENENGEISISNIGLGSPAWISGVINKGDILLGIQAEGEEPIDLSYSFLEEVNDAINQIKSNNIKFTIRKESGEVREITLSKANVDSQENFISCFVLHGSKRLGYISLPAFYTDFDKPNGLGCANDVAKALLKLQSEKVEGVILDLRYNGGGSLKEALDLAGIFINEGLVLMQTYQDKKAKALKDPNRGAVYTGPLVVMVNGFSASASEIVSGILQDYNRAIVVGNTTFGKATGQIILPIDANIISNGTTMDESRVPGFLKITIEKFYRLNSVSYQASGVQPDITLPDYFSSLKISESTLPYCLKSDTTLRKINYISGTPLPLNLLTTKSKERVDAYNWSKEVINFSANTNKVFFPESVAVSFMGFNSNYQQNHALMSKFRSAFETQNTSLFEVKTPNADLIFLKEYANSYQSALENIKTDPYLAEAYLILSDLVELK